MEFKTLGIHRIMSGEIDSSHDICLSNTVPTNERRYAAKAI